MKRRDCGTILDVMDVIMENHFGWVVITCRVSREGIRGPVFDARDMDHFEVVPQGFFLQVPQSGIADIIQGSVPKYLE